MCGRYSLAGVGEFDPADFGLPEFPPEVTSRYNIAPSQDAPVVVYSGEPRVALFRWGLVPSWAEDEKTGFRMINARAETLADRPAFREAYRHRRCLVPADGFYEWKRKGKVKTPYHIRMKSREPFAFAGLWESWRRPDGDELLSFAIVTTTPNEVMTGIHDRMPAIISIESHDTWLNSAPADPSRLSNLLMPCPADGMEAVEVSTLVNSPAHDVPECMTPVTGVQGQLL